jgi:hypothetical protein
MDAVVIGAKNAHPSKCLLVQSEISPLPAVLSGYRRPGKPAKYRHFFIRTRQGRMNLAKPKNCISNFRGADFSDSIASGFCGAASTGFETCSGGAASGTGVSGTMGGATGIAEAFVSGGCGREMSVHRFRATSSPLSKSATSIHC